MPLIKVQKYLKTTNRISRDKLFWKNKNRISISNQGFETYYQGMWKRVPIFGINENLFLLQSLKIKIFLKWSTEYLNLIFIERFKLFDSQKKVLLNGSFILKFFNMVCININEWNILNKWVFYVFYCPRRHLYDGKWNI